MGKLEPGFGLRFQENNFYNSFDLESFLDFGACHISLNFHKRNLELIFQHEFSELGFESIRKMITLKSQLR